MSLKRSVYLVFAAIFPLMVCSGIIYSVFALYILELGATEAVIGFIFATGSATAAFTGPLFGKLSDMFGRKRLLMFSMGIFVIVFLLYSMANNFLDIAIIQGLEGIAWGAEGATALALIADIVPPVERGQAMGMYNMVWNLGWIVGPALGGVLAQLVGFRSMFMICSLMILFGLALTILLVKPTAHHEGELKERSPE